HLIVMSQNPAGLTGAPGQQRLFELAGKVTLVEAAEYLRQIISFASRGRRYLVTAASACRVRRIENDGMQSVRSVNALVELRGFQPVQLRNQDAGKRIKHIAGCADENIRHSRV